MRDQKITEAVTEDLGSPSTGLQALIDAYKGGIDRTLIRRNLSLSVDERFEQLMSLQRFAEELGAAGKRASQMTDYPTADHP